MFALLLLATSVRLSNFAGAIGIGVSGTDARIRWRIGVVSARSRPGCPSSAWRSLSLDNLALGFALGTLAAGPVGLLLSAVVIGSVRVAMVLAGLERGARIGAAAQSPSELFRAVILITVAA